MANKKEIKTKCEKLGINYDLESIMDIIIACQEYDENISIEDILYAIDISLSVTGFVTIESVIDDIEFLKEMGEKHPELFDQKLNAEREQKITEIASVIDFFEEDDLNKAVARKLIDMDEEQRKTMLVKLNDPKVRERFIADYLQTKEIIRKEAINYNEIRKSASRK